MKQSTFTVLLMLLLSSASYAEIQLNATMLSLPCTGCHGSEGKSQRAIPSLNVMSREQIYRAMKSFKNDQRHATLMNRIAKGYSDSELRLIADYFGVKP